MENYIKSVEAVTKLLKAKRKDIRRIHGSETFINSKIEEAIRFLEMCYQVARSNNGKVEKIGCFINEEIVMFSIISALKEKSVFDKEKMVFETFTCSPDMRSINIVSQSINESGQVYGDMHIINLCDGEINTVYFDDDFGHKLTGGKYGENNIN